MSLISDARQVSKEIIAEWHEELANEEDPGERLILWFQAAGIALLALALFAVGSVLVIGIVELIIHAIFYLIPGLLLAGVIFWLLFIRKGKVDLKK